MFIRVIMGESLIKKAQTFLPAYPREHEAFPSKPRDVNLSRVSLVCPRASFWWDMFKRTHTRGILVRCSNHLNWLLL